MVELGPQAPRLQTSRVTIGDVAKLTGGSSALRTRISSLDLDTLNATSGACRISRRQLEMRILVDGLPRTDFRVVGPTEIVVRGSTAKQLQQHLEQRIADEITRQFGLDPETVGVRLDNLQQIQSTESLLANAPFQSKVLLQTKLPIGKVAVQMEFEKAGGERFLQSFDARVIVSMEVALANQPISRGTVVEAGMLSVIRRPIVEDEAIARPEQVIGRVASRDIASNAVVLSSYVADAAAVQRPTIRPNDLLDVTIRLGAHEIRLKNAKALSAGRIGETITVLNTQSNKQFSATVVNRNLAQVMPLAGNRR